MLTINFCKHVYYIKDEVMFKKLSKNDGKKCIIFIQIWITRNIQYWMKIQAYNYHPKTDDKKHPILDENTSV